MQNQRIRQEIEYFFLTTFAAIAGTVYCGIVFGLYWRWFIMPLSSSIPDISLAHATALCMFFFQIPAVRLLWSFFSIEEMTWREMFHQQIQAFLVVMGLWGIGFLLSLFA